MLQSRSTPLPISLRTPVKNYGDFTPRAARYHHQFNVIRRQEALCKLPICKATTADVHGELQTIAREKTRRIQGERRDQRTPKNTRNSLSGAFKYAVNKRVIPTNPVCGVITPRGARPKKTHANTLNEIYALLAALKDEPAHTACLTVALSRLSQSELVALKWVDIVDGEIRVRHRTSLNLWC